MQVKVESANVLGYEAMHTRGPVSEKPERGFVYVQFEDGSEGAIPKKDVSNWDDLPDTVTVRLRKKEKP